MKKPTVGIIGVGLIGGSLALAASRAGYPVLATDNDPGVKEDFMRRTGAGWAHSRQVLVEKADIIVLAVPADAVPGVVESIIPALRPGKILTDVSSTKVSPTMALRAAPTGVRIVGSHPMAGKAGSGFAEADEHLFEGCTWVLCPDDGEVTPAALSKLIVDVGAQQTLVCTPEEHDRAVAAISHGVQVGATSLAAAVNAAVADSRLPWLLAAGGWRDSTRIAESDPNMWIPILLENGENVIPILDELEHRVHAMRDAVAAADAEQIRRLIVDGQQARKAWKEARGAEPAA